MLFFNDLENGHFWYNKQSLDTRSKVLSDERAKSQNKALGPVQFGVSRAFLGHGAAWELQPKLISQLQSQISPLRIEVLH